MTLRIRFPQGKLVRRQHARHRELLLAATSLLTPMCVMAYVLALWRLASDIGMAAEPGSRGLLSHWQVWILVGMALQFGGRFFTSRANTAEAGHELDPAPIDAAPSLDQATR